MQQTYPQEHQHGRSGRRNLRFTRWRASSATRGSATIMGIAAVAAFLLLVELHANPFARCLFCRNRAQVSTLKLINST